MTKTICVRFEDPKPVIRYGHAKPDYRHYYWTLAFVGLLGAACLLAWFMNGFSLASRSARGDARAQYLLGKRYFDQAICPRDYVTAASFIQKSADQGYAKAETALGLLYENGLGVKQDYNLALKWLRKGANQGYSVAQNELGVMYAKGRGVSRNLGQTITWCQLAAAQGSEVARRNLELARFAQSGLIPHVVTSGKESYESAVVQKVEADAITVSFQPVRGGFGVARLKLDNLSSELQELCKYANKEGFTAGSVYTQLCSVSASL